MERLQIHPDSPLKAEDWSLPRIETLYSNGSLLTRKDTQEVKLCRDKESSYIVKKYLSNSFLQALREWTGHARPDRAFGMAATLRELGTPVPRHHMIAKKGSLRRTVSYLIMEEAPGTPLIKYLQSGNFDVFPKTTEEHIIAIVEKLQRAGIAHGDFHTRNLIVADDGQVSLIDLDNAAKTRRRLSRDIRRLHRALLDYPNPLKRLQDFLAGKPGGIKT